MFGGAHGSGTSLQNPAPGASAKGVPDCICDAPLWRRRLPAGDFWERAAAPLRTLLERNNLTSADVTAVELLGGTSRVPRLKQALSDVLGGRALDM